MQPPIIPHAIEDEDGQGKEKEQSDGDEDDFLEDPPQPMGQPLSTPQPPARQRQRQVHPQQRQTANARLRGGGDATLGNNVESPSPDLEGVLLPSEEEETDMEDDEEDEALNGSRVMSGLQGGLRPVHEHEMEEMQRASPQRYRQTTLSSPSWVTRNNSTPQQRLQSVHSHPRPHPQPRRNSQTGSESDRSHSSVSPTVSPHSRIRHRPRPSPRRRDRRSPSFSDPDETFTRHRLSMSDVDKDDDGDETDPESPEVTYNPQSPLSTQSLSFPDDDDDNPIVMDVSPTVAPVQPVPPVSPSSASSSSSPSASFSTSPSSTSFHADLVVGDVVQVIEWTRTLPRDTAQLQRSSADLNFHLLDHRWNLDVYPSRHEPQCAGRFVGVFLHYHGPIPDRSASILHSPSTHPVAFRVVALHRDVLNECIERGKGEGKAEAEFDWNDERNVWKIVHRKIFGLNEDYGFNTFIDHKDLRNYLDVSNQLHLRVYLQWHEDAIAPPVRKLSSFLPLNGFTQQLSWPYLGMRNQGATCYMNSYLQTLFYLPLFRHAVFNIPIDPNQLAKFSLATGKAASSSAMSWQSSYSSSSSSSFSSLLTDTRSPSPAMSAGSTSSIALALQLLFYRLQKSAETVDTSELTQSFGWDKADSFTQHDIQEFSRVLLDNLEESAKKAEAQLTQSRAAHASPTRPHSALPSPSPSPSPPPKPSSITRFFEGSIQTYIECIDVNYESKRTESFLDLQLNVKNLRSLTQSFKQYVEEERLEGDNKYRAKDEARNIDYGMQAARKGVRFLRFPKVLQIQLKRFDYDFQTNGMKKINDRFEFPMLLDLTEYEMGEEVSDEEETVTEHKQSSAASSAVDTAASSSAASSAAASSSAAVATPSPSPGATSHPRTRRYRRAAPDDPPIYHLQSVLVHRGSQHGGHYYAFIRPFLQSRVNHPDVIRYEDCPWFKFDDDIVSLCRSSTEAICRNFGGRDNYVRKQMLGMTMDVSLNTHDSTSAYMLVYVRQKVVQAGGMDPDAPTTSSHIHATLPPAMPTANGVHMDSGAAAATGDEQKSGPISVLQAAANTTGNMEGDEKMVDSPTLPLATANSTISPPVVANGISSEEHKSGEVMTPPTSAVVRRAVHVSTLPRCWTADPPDLPAFIDALRPSIVPLPKHIQRSIKEAERIKEEQEAERRRISMQFKISVVLEREIVWQGLRVRTAHEGEREQLEPIGGVAGLDLNVAPSVRSGDDRPMPVSSLLYSSPRHEVIVQRDDTLETVCKVIAERFNLSASHMQLWSLSFNLAQPTSTTLIYSSYTLEQHMRHPQLAVSSMLVRDIRLIDQQPLLHQLDLTAPVVNDAEYALYGQQKYHHPVGHLSHSYLSQSYPSHTTGGSIYMLLLLKFFDVRCQRMFNVGSVSVRRTMTLANLKRLVVALLQERGIALLQRQAKPAAKQVSSAAEFDPVTQRDPSSLRQPDQWRYEQNLMIFDKPPPPPAPVAHPSLAMPNATPTAPVTLPPSNDTSPAGETSNLAAATVSSAATPAPSAGTVSQSTIIPPNQHQPTTDLPSTASSDDGCTIMPGPEQFSGEEMRWKEWKQKHAAEKAAADSTMNGVADSSETASDQPALLPSNSIPSATDLAWLLALDAHVEGSRPIHLSAEWENRSLIEHQLSNGSIVVVSERLEDEVLQRLEQEHIARFQEAENHALQAVRHRATRADPVSTPALTANQIDGQIPLTDPSVSPFLRPLPVFPVFARDTPSFLNHLRHRLVLHCKPACTDPETGFTRPLDATRDQSHPLVAFTALEPITLELDCTMPLSLVLHQISKYITASVDPILPTRYPQLSNPNCLKLWRSLTADSSSINPSEGDMTMYQFSTDVLHMPLSDLLLGRGTRDVAKYLQSHQGQCIIFYELLPVSRTELQQHWWLRFPFVDAGGHVHWVRRKDGGAWPSDEPFLVPKNQTWICHDVYREVYRKRIWPSRHEPFFQHLQLQPPDDTEGSNEMTDGDADGDAVMATAQPCTSHKRSAQELQSADEQEPAVKRLKREDGQALAQAQAPAAAAVNIAPSPSPRRARLSVKVDDVFILHYHPHMHPFTVRHAFASLPPFRNHVLRIMARSSASTNPLSKVLAVQISQWFHARKDDRKINPFPTSFINKDFPMAQYTQPVPGQWFIYVTPTLRAEEEGPTNAAKVNKSSVASAAAAATSAANMPNSIPAVVSDPPVTRRIWIVRFTTFTDSAGALNPRGAYSLSPLPPIHLCIRTDDSVGDVVGRIGSVMGMGIGNNDGAAPTKDQSMQTADTDSHRDHGGDGSGTSHPHLPNITLAVLHLKHYQLLSDTPDDATLMHAAYDNNNQLLGLFDRKTKHTISTSSQIVNTTNGMTFNGGWRKTNGALSMRDGKS